MAELISEMYRKIREGAESGDAREMVKLDVRSTFDQCVAWLVLDARRHTDSNFVVVKQLLLESVEN